MRQYFAPSSPFLQTTVSTGPSIASVKSRAHIKPPETIESGAVDDTNAAHSSQTIGKGAVYRDRR